MIDSLTGLVDSPADLATFVLVCYLALREGRLVTRTRAAVVALARGRDDVDADRLARDLQVDDVDVEAVRTDGGEDRR